MSVTVGAGYAAVCCFQAEAVVGSVERSFAVGSQRVVDPIRRYWRFAEHRFRDAVAVKIVELVELVESVESVDYSG